MTTSFSRGLSHTIADVRARFHDYAVTFNALTARRSDLAPAFVAAFHRYHRETGRTFVSFVQLLDSSVPARKAEYERHQAYQAALFLKRRVEAPETVAGAGRKTLSPFRVAATVIRSVLPVVHPHEAFFWGEIKRVSRWEDRHVERLQRAVTCARRIPLKPDQPRLVHGTRPRATAADRG